MPSDTGPLLDLIYDAAVEPSLWPDALSGLANQMGGVGAMISAVDFRRPQDAVQITGGLDPTANDLYLKYYQDNPLSRRMENVPQRQALLSPVDAPIKRTAFCTDVLVPQRLVGFAQMSLNRTLGVDSGGIAIAYTKPPEQAHARFLQTLAPHFERALLTTQKVANKFGAIADQVLDAVSDVVILLDRRGRIFYANRHAEALLRRNDPLKTSDGVICAKSPDETSRLLALIADAANTAETGEGKGGGDLCLRGNNNSSLIVTLTPLRHAPHFGWRRPTVLLLASNRELTPSVHLQQRLKLLYGLTTAEGRIAVALADGMTIEEAAAQFSLSRETVRTHLKRIFEKVEVNRQTRLVKLIASMVP